MTGCRWLRAVVHAAAVVLLIALVSGCASMRPPIVLKASFDPQSAAFINHSGRAKVSGQAFFRLNSGKLFRATGTDVFLIPRTTYADERIAALYGGGKSLRSSVRVPDADPRYKQYMRTTVATSGGSFSFDHVADGEYYIVAMLHIPSESMFIQFPILERVTVRGGESVRLVMRGY